MNILQEVGTTTKECKQQEPLSPPEDDDALDEGQRPCDKMRSRESLKQFLDSANVAGTAAGVPLLGKEEDTTPPLSKYVRLKPLGNGAYGEAWLCKERGANVSTPDQMVVAKIMALPQMSAKEMLYAQSEIQCMASVKHTNVIRFIASQCNDTQLIIVMEFADAGDLRRHIKTRIANKSHLTESEAILLFLQLVMALEHIHSHCMLHRDLKTANVLISSSGLVKLADFGFSRRYEDTVSNAVAKTFCGTPYYLAPEIWHNRRYSNKAEVWSLGILLYELLSLQRPFTANTIKGLMEQVCTGKYPPLPSAYSAGASELVAALLSLDPARRPSTLEIFMIPYVNQQLDVLIQLVGENPHVSEEIKKGWRAEAATLKAKIQAAQAKKGVQSATSVTVLSNARNAQEQKNANAVSGSVPGGVNENIFYEGPILKLTTAPKHTWTNKFLVLAGGQLHLCEAQGKNNDKRSLPVDTLQSVTKIPENVAKRQWVFAIHTKDSKCTWLQAPSEAEQTAWVMWIQVAMGAIC